MDISEQIIVGVQIGLEWDGVEENIEDQSRAE